MSEHKQHPDGVGEPQMRIGQRPQLVLVVLRRLMVGCFPDFDRQQIVGDRALVHHDIGIDRFRQMIVSRNDRSMRQPQRALAEPVIVAIDLPAGKLSFDLHRKPMRQGDLAEILFENIALAGVEFLQGGHDLVQLGLHLASDQTVGRRRARRRCALTSALRSGAAPARRSPRPRLC